MADQPPLPIARSAAVTALGRELCSMLWDALRDRGVDLHEIAAAIAEAARTFSIGVIEGLPAQTAFLQEVAGDVRLRAPGAPALRYALLFADGSVSVLAEGAGEVDAVRERDGDFNEAPERRARIARVRLELVELIEPPPPPAPSPLNPTPWRQ